ncbi:adenylate/guanylate cyclase domain-containing protein [Allocoleopsis franciscana]|uniref:Adenylate cyclase n=1 Tax=Allocoleopsis franciscana PCC 7113 TaxID=1173027 RepID=K9W9I5_9CYAN|nr:adenylate/guanylate cyclase domain-containing protein [Allocoleopsis franciscana]AFZ17045.1 PAS domain S-box [Allocoleopsis franciscana PCC 7113]
MSLGSDEKGVILIVDDNPDTLDLLFFFLSDSDFTVLVAQNGKIALQIVEESHPDLILLDVMMPGIDGFEICRRLKANEASQDIPVIFMTALSDTEDKVKGFNVGAVDYITKPIQEEVLKARITTHLTIRNLNCSLVEQNKRLQAEIRERQQKEEELRLSNQAIAASSDGIVIADARKPDMPITYVNPAFERLTGYQAEEVVGRNCRFLQGKDTDQPALNELREAIREGKGCKVILSNYRKNGTLFWNELSVSPIYDAEGNLTHFVGIQSDITERKVAQEALHYQQEQTENLLLNILPKPIAERLKLEPSTIADSFEEVSVLFADLVGFTEFSNRRSAKELVEVLNVIFSGFDKLAEKHDLEKIKTIGDAYMVVAGLPMPRPDHTSAIAQMALDMQQSLTQVNAETGESFKMRIGINSGSVVAGVIGLKKFSYDLWGDTVNTASRMESLGIPGTIQVTAQTYERLRDQFIFEERGIIPVKGKGEMTTYLLKGRKS